MGKLADSSCFPYRLFIMCEVIDSNIIRQKVMIFIGQAQAQETTETIGADGGNVAPMPEPASPAELFGSNILVVVILVVLFYVLLIRPQQKRLQDHTKMLQALKKGDEVITGGGLIGKVEKVDDAKDEIVVDLGNGIKVSALRSTIQAKDDPRLRGNTKPANDSKDKDQKVKK